MVQFEIREGAKKQQLAFNRFPVVIGRSEGCHVQINSSGVWPQHAELSLERSGSKFSVRALGEAILFVDGQKVLESPLRNGAILRIGAAELIFLFSPCPQKSLLPKELFFWLILAGVILAQALLQLVVL